MKEVEIVRRHVRGAVLVQFAMLSFAIMAIMAVAIDIGLLRGVQASMRAGSEAAALEGIRMRDAYLCPPAATPEQCALLKDLERRRASRRAMAMVYDEDMNLATRNVDTKFGFGGFIDTGIDTDGELEPTGLDEALDAYNPNDGSTIPFQLNTDNYAHGDMVAGDYDPSFAGAPEDVAYNRADFADLLPAQAAAADSFLVRTRRGTDPFGLDQIAGVSSSGPQIPILFGLGAMISKEELSRYDPRRDGFTVRSTAIAAAQPALAAGLASLPGSPRPYIGVLRVGQLSDGRWATVALDGLLNDECVAAAPGRTIEVLANGNVGAIGSGLLGPCVSLNDIGRVTAVADSVVEFGNSLEPVGTYGSTSTSDFDVTQVATYAVPGHYYLPVVRTFRGSPQGIAAGFDPGCADRDDPNCYQVVGFIAVEVTSVTLDFAGTIPKAIVEFVKLPKTVAPVNATAMLRSSIRSLIEADPLVRQARRYLSGGPHLQAPVLVR